VNTSSGYLSTTQSFGGAGRGANKQELAGESATFGITVGFGSGGGGATHNLTGITSGAGAQGCVIILANV
jgi:hypothetical protein